jgi:dihydroflavonol-4-reductase
MTAARALVTGATGYLGRHLLGALRQSGISAAALVRQQAAWAALPWRAEVGDISVIEGSPLVPQAFLSDSRLSAVKTIFHTAGIVHHSRSPHAEMQALNVGGTLQMVHAAKALGARLVFVSSSGTVGCFPFPDMTADEDAPFAERLVARWPYYASKIRAEREARRLADQLGVELVIVRPPVLLGPDDHRRRSTGYVQKVLDGKIPAVPQGGMHFTDVRDTASALARLAELPNARAVYHLPGTASSLNEFFDMVIDVSGAAFVRRPLPRWAALCLAKVASVSPRRPSFVPDPVVLEMSTCYWGLSSLFARELGYAPRPGRQTLSDTVAWLRANTAPAHAHAGRVITARPAVT